MTIRETFLKIAELLGAETDNSTVYGIRVNEDYFISVQQRDRNIRMALVKDAHTGNGLDNTLVSFETLNAGASDKVIMNRYNKLVANVEK